MFGHPNVNKFDKTLGLLYNIVTLLHKEYMTTSTPKISRFVTTEQGGRQNIFAAEPKISYVENYEGYGKNAEKLNGRLAMLGLVSGFVSYIATGNFFFGGILGF